MTSPRAVVLSLGGSPEPVLASIQRQRPEVLVFFVSPESRRTLEGDVLAKLPEGYRPAWEMVETPSAELLVESYRALVEGLPHALSRRGISWGEVRADFTGGTKAMSAALVLALVDRGCEFTYVGGVDALAREKGGLGVVVSGREKLFLTGDPWTEVAAGRLRAAVQLFASGRLDAAVAGLPEPPPRGRTGALARALRPVFEGFRDWDLQRYTGAARGLRQGIEAWELFAEGSGDPAALRYLEMLREAAARLERVRAEWEALKGFRPGLPVAPGIDALAIPCDLCGAAARRARVGGDPEDGVLLLYAAVEKLAKGRLAAGHGIDNSRCPADRLGPLAPKYEGRIKGGFAEVPLEDSFVLLRELGDSVGNRFFENHDFLKKLQHARNHSWREHGYVQVERNTFERLFPEVLSFLGLGEEDLVAFPVPTGF